jgi:hypothetical protein
MADHDRWAFFALLVVVREIQVACNFQAITVERDVDLIYYCANDLTYDFFIINQQ